VALIASFEPIGAGTSGRVHGEVNCGWAIFESDGRRYLQLDTYGSRTRAMPGKVSQSIQLNEEGAGELVRLLAKAFPGVAP
jgi:hypothetical protein